MLQLPTIPGGFGTAIVDPPWQFCDQGSRIATGWADGGRRGYVGMSDQAIVALPVSRIMAPDSYLICWFTDAHLEVALRATKAWGFRYVQILDWNKRCLDGSLRMGFGHYFRHVAEHALFCVRGRPGTFGERAIPAGFDAPVGEHSVKPYHFHEVAEAALRGPFVELFARRPREGWVTWGDQLDMAV